MTTSIISDYYLHCGEETEHEHFINYIRNHYNLDGYPYEISNIFIDIFCELFNMAQIGGTLLKATEVLFEKQKGKKGQKKKKSPKKAVKA